MAWHVRQRLTWLRGRVALHRNDHCAARDFADSLLSDATRRGSQRYATLATHLALLPPHPGATDPSCRTRRDGWVDLVMTAQRHLTMAPARHLPLLATRGARSIAACGCRGPAAGGPRRYQAGCVVAPPAKLVLVAERLLPPELDDGDAHDIHTPVSTPCSDD
ncbi:MAG: hypothetical protein IPP16_17510 [Acidimicrobiaceae bacterium]|nr:hypothetical protein [Acidimicrobiaceae bacterium]